MSATMSIVCVCGYVGHVPATGDAACPECQAPVRSHAKLHTDNVEARRHEWGLLVRCTSKQVKLVDSEQIQRIVFDMQPDAAVVVIDLQGVEVMGSSALSVLVRVSMERRLGLVNVAPRVHDTVRAMGLGVYLPTYPDLDAARAALA